MGTTSEELKKLYSKLGGDEENIRRASTPGEILNGINELDLTIDTLPDVTPEDNGKVLGVVDGKWDEMTIEQPETEVTKTVKGNPVEFTDGAAAPLVKCVSAITGSQDLNGYDRPWVGGSGKNKLENPLTSQTLNYVTYTINDDGSVLANGTASPTSNLVFYENTTPESIGLANGTYILSGCPSGGGAQKYGFRVTLYDSDNNQTRASDYGSGATFTIDENVASIRINIFIVEGSTINDTFYPMIRLSTETDPTFAPYSNICPITAYDEGNAGVRGKNVVDNSVSAWESGGISNADGQNASSDNHKRTKGYFKIDSNTSYYLSGIDVPSDSTSFRIFTYDKDKNYIAYSNFKNTFTSGSEVVYIRIRCANSIDISNFMFEKGTSPTTYEPYTSTDYTTTYPSAIYRGSEDVVNGSVTSEWGYIASYNGETLPGEWISDRDEYVPGTTPTTGAEVAYELAAPTTTPVTPTNAPVKSLNGYNHIESSTGEIDVEYITKSFQPIVDLIEANSGSGSSYGETTLWSGSQDASTSGDEITLDDNISNYDMINITLNHKTYPNEGGSVLLAVSGLTIGGNYIYAIYPVDYVYACFEYTSDNKLTVKSVQSGNPLTYTKVTGIKH